MGVPTSEVGYTSATTGRGDHQVHIGHVMALGKKHKHTHKLIKLMPETKGLRRNTLQNVQSVTKVTWRWSKMLNIDSDVSFEPPGI
jgi:hypothetical protein